MKEIRDLDLEAATMSDSLPPLSSNISQKPLNELHPIIATMHEQELGKAMLSLAVLVAVATFFQKSPFHLGPQLFLIVQILLSIGCVTIWNGILLRRTYPEAAFIAEQVGVALVFLALNMSLASVVAKGLLWFPMLCFGFWILPFVIAALPSKVAS